jgi:thioredoxin 1
MKILKFEAEWCGPCKMLGKTMESLVFPYPIDVINIDEDTQTPMKYGIRGVPAMVLLDEEESVVKVVMGIQSKKELMENFDAKEADSTQTFDGYQ